MAELTDLTGELLDSIAALLEARHDRAALVLLYSSIDILGAMCVAGGQATRSSFTAWCDAYMRPLPSLGCSSEELYSARCGMLHNMSAKTSLTSQGRARELVYVRDILNGPMMPAPSPDPGIVLMNPGALWQCFRAGVREFIAEVGTSGRVATEVAANFRDVYVTVERR